MVPSMGEETGSDTATSEDAWGGEAVVVGGGRFMAAYRGGGCSADVAGGAKACHEAVGHSEPGAAAQRQGLIHLAASVRQAALDGPLDRA